MKLKFSASNASVTGEIKSRYHNPNVVIEAWVPREESKSLVQQIFTSATPEQREELLRIAKAQM